MNAKKSSSKPVDTSRGRAGRPQSLFAPTSGTPEPPSIDDGEPETADAGIAAAVAAAPTAAQSVEHHGGTAAIATVELTRSYGDTIALEPLSVNIPAGQRVALVGHNGSGKTTLIRMITGTLDATGGSVTIGGHDVGSIEARAALSYLADQPVFYDDLSLIEHIEYIARLHGRADWTDHATELMERFAIEHRADDLPITFSRGLKQKAAICLAFIRPFDVLIVDEPFVGLDAPGRGELLALFDEAHEAGQTLLVATHELHTVAASDRLLALADGVLIHDGPADVDVDALVDGVEPSS
ncbi:MAG TPA: ABC transporter ATP-binding protein [Ilumatobacter sp.]|nr:ABC transporter ATP-binding protein [Ilumatobacter sp.]